MKKINKELEKHQAIVNTEVLARRYYYSKFPCSKGSFYLRSGGLEGRGENQIS
ncbi:MAG: hypothetical protein ACMUEL_09645 [Flavobacteriales bacterium Tduv]